MHTKLMTISPISGFVAESSCNPDRRSATEPSKRLNTNPNLGA